MKTKIIESYLKSNKRTFKPVDDLKNINNILVSEFHTFLTRKDEHFITTDLVIFFLGRNSWATTTSFLDLITNK